MRKSLTLGMLVCLLYAGPIVGQSVGVADFAVPTRDAAPAFQARFWYPTSQGPETRLGDSRIRIGYLARPDAEVALSSPAPLIVLLHGSGGSADSMAWLAQPLARLGAVVVAANHPDSSGGDPERWSILKVWTQPEDTGRLLDAISESKWNRHLDPQRTAVIGFSLGGTSAMLLAGLQLRMERFRAFCEEHEDGACRAFRRHFSKFDKRYLARANSLHGDSRFRAAVAIAPAFTETLASRSLEILATPLLLVAGQKDQQLPPTTHMHPMLDAMPSISDYLEIAEAQHFSFLPLCADGAVDILAETDEEFVCQEDGERTRQEIHAQVVGAIRDFLEQQGVLE